jgi:hypothetical protein
MTTFLFIYLIGFIASFVFMICFDIRKGNDITVGDVVFYFFISLGSLISFMFSLFGAYHNVVVYKSKKK